VLAVHVRGYDRDVRTHRFSGFLRQLRCAVRREVSAARQQRCALAYFVLPLTPDLGCGEEIEVATPDGVPVATMSPGSSVITCDTYESSFLMENTISALDPRWRSTPFTRVTTVRSPSS